MERMERIDQAGKRNLTTLNFNCFHFCHCVCVKTFTRKKIKVYLTKFGFQNSHSYNKDSASYLMNSERVILFIRSRFALNILSGRTLYFFSCQKGLSFLRKEFSILVARVSETEFFLRYSDVIHSYQKNSLLFNLVARTSIPLERNAIK